MGCAFWFHVIFLFPICLIPTFLLLPTWRAITT